MILTIHQPEHLPYLGLIYKIAQADVFMVLDDADYEKDNVQNRNRIRTDNGWQWLTVPVTFSLGTKINKVEIASRDVKLAKWLRTIEHYYHRARYFKDHYSFFKDVASRGYTRIEQLNTAIIIYLVNELIGSIKIIKASSFDICTSSTQRVVDLCVAAGASVFVSGHGAKAYLEIDKFSEVGVGLQFTDFKHPIYKQVYEPFISHMSAIDLLFNYGPDAKAIIAKCNQEQVIV